MKFDNVSILGTYSDPTEGMTVGSALNSRSHLKKFWAHTHWDQRRHPETKLAAEPLHQTAPKISKMKLDFAPSDS